MKKLHKALVVGLATLITTGSAAAAAKPLHWISLSSNVSGGVAMNCKGMNGGTGAPMLITSTPTVSWWGGITSHFNSTFMKCSFSSARSPTTAAGSMIIRVWTVPNLPGALSATIYTPVSKPGYVLTATGSKPLPPPGHQPSFYNYTVSINTAK